MDTIFPSSFRHIFSSSLYVDHAVFIRDVSTLPLASLANRFMIEPPQKIRQDSSLSALLALFVSNQLAMLITSVKTEHDKVSEKAAGHYRSRTGIGIRCICTALRNSPPPTTRISQRYDRLLPQDGPEQISRMRRRSSPHIGRASEPPRFGVTLSGRRWCCDIRARPRPHTEAGW